MAHRGDVRLYTQPWTRLLAQRRAEQRFHRGDRACGVRITRLLPGLSARGVRGAGVRRDPRPRDPARLAAHRGARAAQPANRTDPGPHWPWIPYLHRVQALCGEIVVDDSAQFNDPAVAMVSVPAAWTAADTTPDYYGGGHRWAPTQPAAGDGAGFSCLVAAAGSRTLDARWTSGTN